MFYSIIQAACSKRNVIRRYLLCDKDRAIVKKLLLHIYLKIKFVMVQRTLNSYASAWAEMLEFLLKYILLS